jgi:tetratricopeptide (TPR) repeat protein
MKRAAGKKKKTTKKAAPKAGADTHDKERTGKTVVVCRPAPSQGQQGAAPQSGASAQGDLSARAIAAHRAGRLEEAISLYGAILRSNPDQPDILNNLGVALRRTKRFDASLAAYQRAARIRPDNAGLWSNMGNCLREMQNFDAARKAHERALALDPKTKSHPFNAGLVARDLNRLDEAVDYFDQALAIDGDYVDALWDRALALLSLGRYAEGWAGYEARRRLPDNPIRPLDGVPEWDGTASLRGKTLLLRAEQGFGDMIQFARFVPLVAQKAGHVILECRKELVPVMKTVGGVGTVLEKGAPLPDFDAHIPLLSLPHVLKIDATDLRKQSRDPYISASSAARLQVAKPRKAVLKVGLVWAGKLNPRDRSCPLERFLPMMSDSRAAFYSFQIDDRRADIARLGAEPFLTDLADHIGDFGDSAALMAQMDLIITIDSAPAHLAGALGLPVWMLQLYTTDWRWMVDRTDSPWYPTMRIYRQRSPGDWDAPFEQLKGDFANLLDAREASSES